MQTFTLSVGPDGRVAIPDTRPGETVTIQIGQPPAATAPERATFATARNGAERAAEVSGRNCRKRGDLAIMATCSMAKMGCRRDRRHVRDRRNRSG